MLDRREGYMDTEEWHGQAVRAADGRVLGIVVGVFAEGPLAGRLRVHGDYAPARPETDSPGGIAVYAVPRQAVLRREQDSLVLGVTLSRARRQWLMHVLRSTAALHVL